jgi:hypothetical protein
MEKWLISNMNFVDALSCGRIKTKEDLGTWIEN